MYVEQKTGLSWIIVTGGKYIFSIKDGIVRYSVKNDTWQHRHEYVSELKSFGGAVVQVSTVKKWLAFIRFTFSSQI